MEFPEHRVASEQAFPVLNRLRAEDQLQRDRGLPLEARTRNATAPTGLFLYSLVRSMRPGLVIEIGSSTAYSTIWMAVAAKEYGGRIVGSEILADRAAEGNRNIVEAGVGDVAAIEVGDGSQIASVYSDIDLVFLDAEKDDYSRHFTNVVGLMRPGGLILTDNVTSHDCSELLELIKSRDDVVTQTLDFERGLEYSIRL